MKKPFALCVVLQLICGVALSAANAPATAPTSSPATAPSPARTLETLLPLVAEHRKADIATADGASKIDQWQRDALKMISLGQETPAPADPPPAASASDAEKIAYLRNTIDIIRDFKMEIDPVTMFLLDQHRVQPLAGERLDLTVRLTAGYIHQLVVSVNAPRH